VDGGSGNSSGQDSRCTCLFNMKLQKMEVGGIEPPSGEGVKPLNYARVRSLVSRREPRRTAGIRSTTSLFF
jgi:hypothetical protein